MGIMNKLSQFTNNIMTSFIPPGDDSEMPDDCNPYVEQDQEYDRKEPSRDRPPSTGGPHTSTSDARTNQARQSEAATSAPAKPVTTINSSGSAVTLTQEGKLVVRVADQQQIEQRVLDHLRGELAKKEQEVQQWQQKYKRERDMKHSELRDIQKQLDSALGREAAQAEHTKQLLALLETRRRELHDAQRFMGTVDAFSEGDVVQHVRDLNAEIFNLAQSLSGTQAKASHLNDRTKGKAEEALVSALGRPLLEMLMSVETHGDTVLLEVSTQVIATNILSWMISTWTNDPESDKLFASVHERIQNSESQSVAGQWRALTRKSAQAEYIGGPQLEDHCTERLVTLLMHAAALSGMHILVPDPKHLATIRIMAEKALKLRYLIGEAMISSDYEVVIPELGSPYATADMEEAYEPRGNARRQGLPVLCCTALGLRRVETINDKRRATILVKPGVCLQTLLEDLGLTDERMPIPE